MGAAAGPRLLRMAPLRHSFAAPSPAKVPPQETWGYTSDADCRAKKGNYIQNSYFIITILKSFFSI